MNISNIVTVLSATIMMGTGLLGAAVSGGWAIGGLMGLGGYGQYGLMALFSAVALWGIGVFVSKAMVAEPFFGPSTD